jgi:hypothetical protein
MANSFGVVLGDKAEVRQLARCLKAHQSDVKLDLILRMRQHASFGGSLFARNDMRPCGRMFDRRSALSIRASCRGKWIAAGVAGGDTFAATDNVHELRFFREFGAR